MFSSEEAALALWLVALLVLNGYFAAAGVALASVRRARLKELAAGGQAGARAALRLLADPERLLSVIQVGISASTLALGWVGQELFRSLCGRMGGPLAGEAPAGLAGAAVFAAALLGTSYVHAAFAEMAPKNLAVARAEKWAVLLAPPLLVFGRASAPFVFLLERSARAFLHAFGLRGELLGGGEAAETLRLIISLHRRHGQLDAFEEGALQRVLDLKDHLVREVMVPRGEIVSLSVEASLEEALERMGERRLGRLPVYEGDPEQIVGLVCSLDLLAAWKRAPTAAGRQPDGSPLRRLMRRPLVVPETKPLNQLLDALRRERSRLAIVVDEHGTVAGLVTLADVLEQIFGKAEAPAEVHPPAEEPAPEVLELDGATTLRELAMRFGIELPIEAGYETLAGFLLYRLGQIPQPGEAVAYENWRFTVLEMEKKRISRIRLERLPAEPDAAGL